MFDLSQELKTLMHRIAIYDDTFTKAEWLEKLQSWSTEIEDFVCEESHVDDYTHEDCYSGDQVNELVKEKTDDLEKEIAALKAKKRKAKKLPSTPDACRAMFKVVSA